MKKTVILLLFSAGLLLPGIYGAIDAAPSGEEILQQKCTKCHSARIPDNYTKKEWKYNVERMARRAGLTAQEIQSVIELNTR